MGVMQLRKLMRNHTRVSPAAMRKMTEDDMVRELRACNVKESVIATALVVPEVIGAPDHEGVDEWSLCVFDMNGDHSEDLLVTNDKEFQGTFRACAMRALDFAQDNPDMQMRVVIERVC